MTLQLDLPKDIEQRVNGEAARLNMPVDTYILSLVDSATPKQDQPSAPIDDFKGYLESLALFVDRTPNYPTDFWTREIVSADEDDE